MAQALDQSRFGPSVSLHVNGLARHVLSSLADRGKAGTGPAGPVRSGSLAALLASVLDGETFDSAMVVAALRAELGMEAGSWVTPASLCGSGA